MKGKKQLTKYIKVEKDTNLEILNKQAELIKNGGIVVFPTETVYGIGTNGLDEKAIRKLYKVKERPLDKPINLLVSDMKMVEELAENITKLEYKLMELFFPGPFTIILKKKKIVPDVLTANNDTVGIRMPDSKIAQYLIKHAGVPIATPSANISGKPSGTNIEDIKNDFKDKVDCYIEGEEKAYGISSTIVKVVDETPYVLREGSIKKEEILLHKIK